LKEVSEKIIEKKNIRENKKGKKFKGNKQ